MNEEPMITTVAKIVMPTQHPPALEMGVLIEAFVIGH